MYFWNLDVLCFNNVIDIPSYQMLNDMQVLIIHVLSYQGQICPQHAKTVINEENQLAEFFVNSQTYIKNHFSWLENVIGDFS